MKLVFLLPYHNIAEILLIYTSTHSQCVYVCIVSSEMTTWRLRSRTATIATSVWIAAFSLAPGINSRTDTGFELIIYCACVIVFWCLQ